MCARGLINMSSWPFLWSLMCGLVQVFFFRLLVNFFNGHFHATTLGTRSVLRYIL